MCECLPAALAQCKFSTYWNRSNQLYAYAMLTLTHKVSVRDSHFGFGFNFPLSFPFFWPTLFRLNNSPAVDFAVVGFFFALLSIGYQYLFEVKEQTEKLQ